MALGKRKMTRESNFFNFKNKRYLDCLKNWKTNESFTAQITYTDCNQSKLLTCVRMLEIKSVTLRVEIVRKIT